MCGSVVLKIVNVNQNFVIFFFSLICQSVFVILPGRQPLQYYLCSNKVDFSQMDDSALKLNWSFLVLQVFSVAIHILAKIRFQIFKVKQQQPVDTQQIKYSDLLAMKKQSISKIFSSFLSIVVFSSAVITGFIINRTNPFEFNKVTFLISI